MSFVCEINASAITMKLDFLEKQKKHLCDEVDKVLTEGRDWLDSTDESLKTFEQVNKMIEEMIFCLQGKDSSPFESSDSKEPASQGETLSTEGASASEKNQSSSAVRENLTRAGPTDQIHHSDVGHEKVPGYMKTILSRLDVMDAAFSSLKTSTEKMSETQTEVQSQIEEVKQNQSLVEERQTKQLADIEKKVKKMGKHSEGMKQQEKRIACLEEEVETLKEREKKIKVFESEIQTLKKRDKKINSLEDEMAAMTSQLHDLEEKTCQKISKVEKQVEVNTDMLYHVKSRTESLSAKTEAMDTAVQDLSNRMDENKSLIDTLSTSRDDDRQKLMNLEQKTQNISRKVNKNQKTSEEKLKEVKTEYKMVCHIVANRLLPLERLRTILNQKIMTRDENVKTLGDVSDKVTNLEQKLKDLENRVSTTVGFTAYLPQDDTLVPDAGNVITSFSRVLCNCGNHFDPSKGMFIAPIDGVYAVYCSLRQWSGGRVVVNVKHKPANKRQVKWVCAAGTWIDKTSASGFRLVRMGRGDSLYVEVIVKDSIVKLGGFSSFSCYKIG